MENPKRELFRRINRILQLSLLQF